MSGATSKGLAHNTAPMQNSNSPAVNTLAVADDVTH
jgi:hypothetical protein